MKLTKKKTNSILSIGILAIAIVGLMTSSSQAGAGIDVLRNMENQLCTASADCTSPGDYIYPTRVFAYTFDSYGSGTEALFYANHPAIVAPEDTEELGAGFQLLPPDTDVSFNFKAFHLPGVAITNLAYWDGMGSVNFTPVSAGNALSIYKTISPSVTISATIDGSATNVDGFTIAQTCGEGGIHEHPNYSLDGDGFAPAQGIYLWSMEIAMPGMNTTEPFFVAMETDHAPLVLDTAIAWVNSNLDSLTAVPEPSSWMLLGGVALGFVWFRKKTRS